MSNIVGLGNKTSQLGCLELIGKKIDQHIAVDNGFPHLFQKFQNTGGDNVTRSGLIDGDYPQFNNSFSRLKQLRSIKKVPLPRQILQHQNFSYCRMGLFPEISRAWMVLDTDIFIWDFEHGSDITYYDGMKDSILGVGLVKPKPGVLDDVIQFLLILTSVTDIIVIGVACTQSYSNSSRYEELQVVSDTVLYSLSTDDVKFHIIEGTKNGRIFMGGSDGNLYELSYHNKSGWWKRNCQKINLSANSLLQYLPAFFSYQPDPDVIIQIVVDNTRFVLYTLSTKGNIVMYDLGADGTCADNRTTISFSETFFAIKRLLQDFSNSDFIVHISAVENTECIHVGLVAITNSGIRIYFTHTSYNGRPYKLRVSHLRVPPGYNGNIPYRPTDVHLAHYSEGTLFMVCGPRNTGGNKLWSVSSDMFPCNNNITELFYTLPVDGVACVISKISSRLNYSWVPDPPLIVRQLYEPSAKFVILSTQGLQIIEKLRPLDMLAELLSDGHEPGSEVVGEFFQCFTEEESCAMLLLLACQHTRNTTSTISDAAARAIPLYASSESKDVKQQTFHENLSSPSFTTSNAFNPKTVSTPVRSRNNNAQHSELIGESPLLRDTSLLAENESLSYSPKHSGFYIYLSRILRLLWNRKVVVTALVEGTLQPVIPEFIIEHCELVNVYLLAFKEFLTKSYFTSPSGRVMDDRTFRTTQSQTLRNVEAMEAKSLETMKLFVDHASQIIGLWKVLYQHEFYAMIKTLSQEQQSYISGITFRELLLSDNSVCSTLISATLTMYLGDTGMVNSISRTLQNVCPMIYRNEDAVYVKANQIILEASNTVDNDQRSDSLNGALRILKEVAPKIDLERICNQFESLYFVRGIYELCSICAKKFDEHDVALNYYHKKDNIDDPESREIYELRMECYRPLMSCLNEMHKKTLKGDEKLLLVSSNASSTASGNMVLTPSDKDSQAQLEELFKLCLSSNDELLHSALYDWILQNKLDRKLLENPTSYLENYLLRPFVAQKFGISSVSNILWSYYVIMDRHVAAAETLLNLAKQESDDLDLQKRIEHLNTALMCLRGDQSDSPSKSALMREIEEIYQVALVQRKAQKMMQSRIASSANLTIPIEQLNKELYNLTELYEKFADKYDLWECKLIIIDCSTVARCQSEIIYQAWDKIIMSECNASGPDDNMNAIVEKVGTILTSLREDSSAVDLDYLIRRLELQSCRLKASKHHVHSMMTSVRISYSKLISIYNVLYTMNNECWKEAGDEYHIIAVIGSFGDSLVEDAVISKANKQYLALHMRDLVTHCLNLLYSRRETERVIELIRCLQSVQRKLDKFM